MRHGTVWFRPLAGTRLCGLKFRKMNKALEAALTGSPERARREAPHVAGFGRNDVGRVDPHSDSHGHRVSPIQRSSEVMHIVSNC